MNVREGEQLIEITSNIHSSKYGGWYTDLVGKQFSLIMRDITSDEYTVHYLGKRRIISMKDAKEI